MRWETHIALLAATRRKKGTIIISSNLEWLQLADMGKKTIPPSAESENHRNFALFLHSRGFPCSWSQRQFSHELPFLLPMQFTGETTLTIWSCNFQVGTAPDVQYLANGGSDDWAKGEAGIKWVHIIHWQTISLMKYEIRPGGCSWWSCLIEATTASSSLLRGSSPRRGRPWRGSGRQRRMSRRYER